MNNKDMNKSKLTISCKSGESIAIAYKIKTGCGEYAIGYVKNGELIAMMSFPEFKKQFASKPALKEFSDPTHLIP